MNAEPLDFDDVARRLVAARRPAGLVPGGEAGQAADRVAGQVAAGGARGGGFAAQSPKAEAGAELSVVADLDRFEGDFLESEAESGPAEAANAGDGHGAPRSAGHGNRGVARPNTPRKLAASLRGRVEAGRLTRREVVANAEFVAHLVQLGVMTEVQAVDLIAVPELIEAELRVFAAENPMDAPLILNALKFRIRVRAEFERLLAAAACSVSPAGERAPEGGFCAAAEASMAEPGLDGSPPEGPGAQTAASGGVT